MREFVQFCSRYNASIIIMPIYASFVPMLTSYVLNRSEATHIQNIEGNEVHTSPDR